MNRFIRSVIGFLGLSFALSASPALAQEPPAWNRSVEAVAILPDDTGGYHVTVMIGAEADGIETISDLSVDVFILVNGMLVEEQPHEIIAYPNSDMSSSCPPCPTFQPCICCEASGICGCGGIIAPAPGTAASHPLQPGDEIIIQAVPPSSALPDSDMSDNELELTFQGEPVFWERRIVSAHLAPPSTPDGTHDLIVEWEVLLAEITYELDLSTEIVVLVNGVVAGGVDACADSPFLISPDNPCLSIGCELQEGCASASCAGASMTLRCRYANSNWWELGCACLSAEPMPLVVPGLVLQPDDEVMVTLATSQRGTPNLPGSEAGATMTLTVPCSADLNGDGVVGGADLGMLLAEWGPCQSCETCQDCPADLTGDCQVGGADLGILLSSWSS